MNRPAGGYFGILLGRAQAARASVANTRPPAVRPGSAAPKYESAHNAFPEVLKPRDTRLRANPPITQPGSPAMPDEYAVAPESARRRSQTHSAPSKEPSRRLLADPDQGQRTLKFQNVRQADAPPAILQTPHASDLNRAAIPNPEKVEAHSPEAFRSHAMARREQPFEPPLPDTQPLERAGHLAEEAAPPVILRDVLEPVCSEPRIETQVQWPAQLAVEQRSTVRARLEEFARERMVALPRRKAAEQRVEIRVDQLNVRVESPPQPAPARPAHAETAEAPFAGFFLQRSLG